MVRGLSGLAMMIGKFVAMVGEGQGWHNPDALDVYSNLLLGSSIWDVSILGYLHI